MTDETKTQLDRIEEVVGTLVEKVSQMDKSVGTLTEKISQTDKNVDDVLEIVVSMKTYIESNLVTKAELTTLEKKVDAGFEEIKSKTDGLNRRIDNEVENRAQIETRVQKVEEMVFPS